MLYNILYAILSTMYGYYNNQNLYYVT